MKTKGIMMRKNWFIAIKTFTACFFYLFVTSAVSENIQSGGVVTFSGEIIEKTCAIDGNPYFTVALPSSHSVKLNALGKKTGETEFHIHLTGCGKIGGGVRARFDIAPEKGKRLSVQFMDTAHTNMAKNIEVELQYKNADGYVVENQNDHYYQIDENGKADLVYVAHYYATDKVTPGKVYARTTYVLEYQ